MLYCCCLHYGIPPDLHVLTHSSPTLCSSELSKGGESTLSRRRARCCAGAAIAAPVAAPYVPRAHFQINPATNRVYSKRTIERVQRAVVIDMLAPIKIDFSPEYYAKALKIGRAHV